jgi:predicted ABC-type ATPase
VTKPSFTLIAGPNGSGKSSLTVGTPDIFKHFPVLDPDAIARTIQVDSKASSALAAGRQALSQAASYLQAGQNFAVETTLSELRASFASSCDIRRRYERSLRNLPLAVSRADHTLLFDNSTQHGYELLAICDNGHAKWFQPVPAWPPLLPQRIRFRQLLIRVILISILDQYR